MVYISNLSGSPEKRGCAMKSRQRDYDEEPRVEVELPGDEEYAELTARSLGRAPEARPQPAAHAAPEVAEAPRPTPAPVRSGWVRLLYLFIALVLILTGLVIYALFQQQQQPTRITTGPVVDDSARVKLENKVEALEKRLEAAERRIDQLEGRRKQ